MNNIYTHIRNASRLLFFPLAMLLVGNCFTAQASSLPLDSIGVEFVSGQKIIIHKLAPKETYYGLGRRYNVAVKQIIAANNNKSLKAGDTLRIPVGNSTVSTSTVTNRSGGDTTTSAQNPIPDLAPGEYTTYKVGQGETLYTISKRFMVSVATIKQANGLTDDSLKTGLLLKVPNEELPPIPTNQPTGTLSEIMANDSTATENTFELPANRYGIREMTEKGVGVWIADLNQVGSNMLALHKTAPVGTVVKITNPMTSRTTFAKVVGKFTDTEETKNAIIVISKSAAELIGVLDRRFHVEIAYGTPIGPSD